MQHQEQCFCDLCEAYVETYSGKFNGEYCLICDGLTERRPLPDPDLEDVDIEVPLPTRELPNWSDL